MDLSALRGFCTLAETLNFRVAAERLHITQPGLSLKLKRLEDELGLRLFDRSRAGVALSDVGRAFLPHAERLLAEAARTRAAAQRIAGGRIGSLRIGYTPVSFFSYVPELVRDFSFAHPDVELVFEERLSGDVETALVDDVIDVGFLHPPVATSDLVIDALESERFVVALAADDPLAARAALRLEELAASPFILPARHVGPALYDRIIALCRAHGFTPWIRQEVTTSTAVLGLVAAGHGVGLVIEALRHVARPGLRFRGLDGAELTLPFAVATRADARLPVIDSFRRHCRDLRGDG